jgi:hypothetical protein
MRCDLQQKTSPLCKRGVGGILPRLLLSADGALRQTPLIPLGDFSH